MFRVKQVPTIEKYCPNGHTPLPDLPSPYTRPVKFCHICGAPLEESQVTHDVAYCANCNNPVDPSWNYCPYCDQGRE